MRLQAAFRLSLCLLTLFSAAACTARTGDSARFVGAGSVSLPVPTKDEVLIVDGRRLSLTGYFALKERYPDLGRESLLWLSTASLALQNHAQTAGRNLQPELAANLAYQALGSAGNPVLPAEVEAEARALFPAESAALSPASLRAAMDRLVTRAVVQRNVQVLAELH